MAHLLPAVCGFEGRRIFLDRLVSAQHRSECELVLDEVFPGASRSFAPIPGAFQWRQAFMGKPMEQVDLGQYREQLVKNVNRYGKCRGDGELSRCRVRGGQLPVRAVGRDDAALPGHGPHAEHVR